MIANLIPYPKMKNSGIEWLGEVPEHWAVKRTKSVLSRNESGVWGEDPNNNGVIVLRSTEQTVSGEWNITAPARRRLTSSEYAACRLREGDLVVTKSSGSPRHIGKTSIVTRDVEALECCFSNFMQRLRVKQNTAPRFVWYAFNGELGRRQLDYFSDTTTGLANLNSENIGRVVLPSPSLSEQAAIVRFLDHADRRIRRYIRAKQKLITLLEEQKQAIIHQAVTGQVDVRTGQPYPAYKPSGVEWLGDVPEHWEVVALKRVLRRLVDCEHKTAPAVGESAYRVVRTTAVRYGSLRWKGTYCTTATAFRDWTKRGLPEPGDVIFTREAPAGEACVIPEGAAVCLGQRTVLMKPQKGEYESHFLVHMIYAGPPRDRIRLASQGSTVGHFNMDDIAWMQVLKPPFSEQLGLVKAISDQTRVLELAVIRAKSEISLLSEYRTRLIADVVTGKLDVRDSAARLPDKVKELEPFDETGGLINGGEEPSDGLDTTLEEAAV